MKKGINYVSASAVLAVLEKCGLPLVPQKGFVKVAGPKGRAVYIAKTERVGRIDVSGFTPDFPGVISLGPDEKFGAVEAQLDFTAPPADILATLELVIEHMITLEPREITRGARAGRAKTWATLATVAEQEVPVASSEMTSEQVEQAGA
jgi:hypothetical protein